MANNFNPNEQQSTGGAAVSSSPAKTEDQQTENSNTGNDNAKDIVTQVTDALHGDTDGVKNLYNKALESGGEVAHKVIDKAKDKASSSILDQKSNLASGLGSIADGIRQMGENLRNTDEPNNFVELTAKYGEKLAVQAENLSDYLNHKNFGELLHDLEGFARRNPTVFVGGAFALGFLTARFLRTSGSPSNGSSKSSNGQNHKTRNDNRNSNSGTQEKSYNSVNEPVQKGGTESQNY